MKTFRNKKLDYVTSRFKSLIIQKYSLVLGLSQKTQKHEKFGYETSGFASLILDRQQALAYHFLSVPVEHTLQKLWTFW